MEYYYREELPLKVNREEFGCNVEVKTTVGGDGDGDG